MYRRLKNLLGVSLIIFAIVLSQVPLGDVQADLVSGEETQETEETTTVHESDTENGYNGETDIMTIDDGEVTGDEVTDGEATDGDGTDTYYTVTFNYGFLEITPDIPTKPVKSGSAINIADSDWKITINGESKQLVKNQSYKIGNYSYEFLGWYTTRECNSAYDMEAQITQNITLYAGWECESSNITFDMKYIATDADTDTSQVVAVTAGTRIKLPNKTPTKTGCNFQYWVERDSNENETELNLDVIPTSPKTFYAIWDIREYTVTFNANGGTFTDGNTKKTASVLRGKTIEEDGETYPEVDATSLTGYSVEADNWYTDQECLSVYDKTTQITKSTTIYKKWYTITDKGFMISADGRVLYGFTGSQEEVVIPSSIKIIASGAFSDLSKVSSIVLPAGVADIKENAFSGALAISREIKIYSQVDGSVDSKDEGDKLATRYSCFTYAGVYGSSSSAGSDNSSSGNATLSEDHITFSLNEISKGIDDNSSFTYPKVYLPSDLAAGEYHMTFTELNEPTTIKTLLEAAKHNLADGYVYYMDIYLKKLYETDEYKVSWETGTMSITMPLPFSWYGRDTDKIKMYTVNTAGTALEEVSLKSAGSNLITFYPQHFSEFALVFTGSDTSSSGGSSSGSGSSGGSSSGSSSSGSSSSGSSSSGSSSSGSSSSGSSSSASSTTTGATPTIGTTATGDGVTTSTTTGTIVTTPTIGTAQTTGTSAGAATGHVKDSTPKTGDPLEYKTLLVCCFFSFGVLLLAIGNKKKASASSGYLQV